MGGKNKISYAACIRYLIFASHRWEIAEKSIIKALCAVWTPDNIAFAYDRIKVEQCLAKQCFVILTIGHAVLRIKKVHKFFVSGQIRKEISKPKKESFYFLFRLFRKKRIFHIVSFHETGKVVDDDVIDPLFI